MIRQSIMTFSGIGLAVLIAFGSLFLTNAMLDAQEDNLLSSIDKIEMHNLFEIEDDVPWYNRPEDYEIFDMLYWHYERGDYSRIEPTADHLSMQQALNAAAALLDEFVGKGILNEDQVTDSYNNSSITLLCPIADPDRYESEAGQELNKYGNIKEELNTEFAYWEIHLQNDMIEARFMIHAQSGFIWNVRINDNYGGFSVREHTEIMSVYLAYFGISEYVQTTEYNDSYNYMDIYWGLSEPIAAFVYYGDLFEMVQDSFFDYIEDGYLWDDFSEYRIEVGMIPVL